MRVKNVLYGIGLALIMAIILGSCQKRPINGDLDGEWEVIEVYPEPTPASEQTRYFYNFSRNACQLTVYGGPFTLGNLVYQNETITLDFPFVNSESMEITLQQYGIFTNPVSFNVEFEGKKRLILSNEDSYVVLKKF